jgi:hypothetical protein
MGWKNLKELTGVQNGLQLSQRRINVLSFFVQKLVIWNKKFSQ